MDKLRMQTANKADENFRKLAAMFPNAVTESLTLHSTDSLTTISMHISMFSRHLLSRKSISKNTDCIPMTTVQTSTATTVLISWIRQTAFPISLFS